MGQLNFMRLMDTATFSQGRPITGYDSAMWVERYLDPGEFEFKYPIDSGLRELLPIDAFVTHGNTGEIGFVESHEIEQTSETGVPTVTTRGRTLDAWLDYRTVGINSAWVEDAVDGRFDFELSANEPAVHARQLIDQFVNNPTYSGDEWLPVDATIASSAAGLGDSEARVIDRGPLGREVRSLLSEVECGLRVVRPGAQGFANQHASNLIFRIHAGVDRRNKVVFTWDEGDLEKAKYLYTRRKTYTAALVQTKWIEVRVILYGGTGFNRRWLFVDAQDIDDHRENAPTGAALDRIKARAKTRGKRELRKARPKRLVTADVSPDTQYQYRTHYQCGDIVKVLANFDESTKMRVVEYAEIEDENGVTEHPTLELLDDD